MNLNKSSTMLATLVLVAVVFAGCHQPEEGANAGTGDGDNGPVPMGILMPLTGDVAGLGVPAAQGARLAVEEINANGGIAGRQIDLKEGDTRFPDTQQAVAEFERLAGEGVEYIVGALASDSTDAVKSRANEREIVLVSPSSTRPALTGPDHGYFFRVIANDDVQGPQAAAIVAEDLGVDSVVVMYQQTGYAQGLKDTFVPSFEQLGGTVDGDPIAWESDVATFDARAQEAVARTPEFIWISGQAPEIANLIGALRGQGYQGQILTSEAIEDSNIFDIACSAVDGVLFTKAAPEEGREALEDFRTAYRDRFGTDPGPFDAFAYDAVYVGAAAIAAVGNDGPAIKGWLEDNGVSGRVTTDTIRFNDNGDVTTGGYVPWEISCSGGEGSFAPYQA